MKGGTQLTLTQARSTVRYTLILRVLEAQLTELDQLGAHLSAAHIDAAITQLQRDIDAIQNGGS